MSEKSKSTSLIAHTHTHPQKKWKAFCTEEKLDVINQLGEHIVNSYHALGLLYVQFVIILKLKENSKSETLPPVTL